MMLRDRWSELAHGRVNPAVPAAVVVFGFALFIASYRWIGAGIAVGACLAYINGILLSRRVDLAAATGDMAGAMAVMQVGLIVTLTIVGISTVVLVKLSLAMAVASAAGFAVAQLAILAAYYRKYSRQENIVETHA